MPETALLMQLLPHMHYAPKGAGQLSLLPLLLLFCFHPWLTCLHGEQTKRKQATMQPRISANKTLIMSLGGSLSG